MPGQSKLGLVLCKPGLVPGKLGLDKSYVLGKSYIETEQQRQ